MPNQYNNNQAFYLEIINKELNELENLESNTALAKHIIAKYKLKTKYTYLKELLSGMRLIKPNKIDSKVFMALYQFEKQNCKGFSGAECTKYLAEKYNLKISLDHFRKQISNYERDC